MTPIVELRAGAARARIAAALGGRITSLQLAGPSGEPLPVLAPYPEAITKLLPWAKGGLYPLIPYSGRIERARLRHDGRVIELAAHPGGEPHTLHGASHRHAWALETATPDSAALRYRHEPDADWPWAFEARSTIRLEPHRCTLELSLVNCGPASMPAGIGAHPYLICEPGDEIGFAAGSEWRFDADFLATAPAPTPSGEVTLGWVLPGTDLTRFYGGWRGAATLRRRSGITLHLDADGSMDHLVVHRPAGTGYVCIEPVSHVANGFNLSANGVAGTGTRILGPGESMGGRVRIAVAP